MEMVTILPEHLCPANRDDAPGSSGRLPGMARAALICVLVFAFLAWRLHVGGLVTFDSAITGWVRADITPGLTCWMILITDLGNLGFVTVLTTLTALFLFACREWGEGLGVAAASLSSWLLYSCLKLVFQRPRPDLPQLVPAGGYSFPSGHATVTAALFFTMGMIYCHHTGYRTGRSMILAAAALLVLLVGVSRVYLGVHYPGDVVAGWAAGGFVALVVAMLLRLDSRAS